MPCSGSSWISKPISSETSGCWVSEKIIEGTAWQDDPSSEEGSSSVDTDGLVHPSAKEAAFEGEEYDSVKDDAEVETVSVSGDVAANRVALLLPPNGEYVLGICCTVVSLH